MQTIMEGEMAKEILSEEAEYFVTFGQNKLFSNLDEDMQELMEEQIDERDDLSELGGNTANEYIKMLYVQNKDLGKVHYYPLVDENIDSRKKAKLKLLPPYSLEIDHEEL